MLGRRPTEGSNSLEEGDDEIDWRQQERGKREKKKLWIWKHSGSYLKNILFLTLWGILRK